MLAVPEERRGGAPAPWGPVRGPQRVQLRRPSRMEWGDHDVSSATRPAPRRCSGVVKGSEAPLTTLVGGAPLSAPRGELKTKDERGYIKREGALS